MRSMASNREEISGEGDGESCGLETRRRRGVKVSKQIPAIEAEEADWIAAEVTAAAGEDCWSVYWGEDQGSGHNTGEAVMKSTKTGLLFSENNLQNGKAGTSNTLDNIQTSQEVEDDQHQNHIEVGNELHLHIASEKYGIDEVSVSEHEIQGHEQNRIVNKINVTELDLEKVLEEQETHELFCPNCHSCITKRVILRKRKRIVQDIQHEERPEKLREIATDVVANSSADSGKTSHDHEPDVFRCLSCFSFFILTNNGFNIFRIFGKRELTVNLQEPSLPHSRLTSDDDAKWDFSNFKPESSRNNRSEEGVVTSHVTSNIVHPGQKNQSSSDFVVSGASATIGNRNVVDNDAAQLQEKLNVSSAEDKTLDCNHSTSVLATVSEAVGVGANYVPNEKINSVGDARLPAELDVSSGGDRLLKDNQSMPALCISEAAKVSSHEANTSINSGGTEQSNFNIVGVVTPPAVLIALGDDIVKPNIIVESSPSERVSQNGKNIDVSGQTTSVGIPHGDVQINVQDRISVESRRDNRWEVLKSIVYGGLIESIISLGVVSSAAGAETSTLNIVALGLANLMVGFFLILHDLSELKNTTAENLSNERASRYWKLLGQRSNFSLHAAVAIVSYILFGLLPPVIYGFTFRETDDKEYKLIALAAVSLICIALLAIAKALVNQPASYIKTLLYYIGLGFTAACLSYVAGMMVDRFLDQLGLFGHHVPVLSPPPPSIGIFGLGSGLLPSVYE